MTLTPHLTSTPPHPFLPLMPLSTNFSKVMTYSLRLCFRTPPSCSCVLRLLRRRASIPLRLHPSHCISPPFHARFLSSLRSTAPPGGSTQTLHFYRTIVDEVLIFEHLLISSFSFLPRVPPPLPPPHSLRPLAFIDVSFTCVVMIYMGARFNTFLFWGAFWVKTVTMTQLASFFFIIVKWGEMRSLTWAVNRRSAWKQD